MSMVRGAEQPSGTTPTPKQVVFLFMAGTVTAVVAFLFGVVVGRGVPVDRPVDAGAQVPAEGDWPTRVGEETLEESAGGVDGDGLSYYLRLEGESAAEESLRAPAAPRAEPSAPAPRPAGRTAPTQAGFTVQVGALRDRAMAQQIADRLVARGYPAFVDEPERDASVAMYRVRVGRYAEHRVAERMRRRLETEEHFRPWITR
ncbi:MAG: SPOR domain-containing protein [Acidobacteria bacterium]|nr:SPOR domain-containing protein [Acidobacteriota bacterium]